jgi:hypothetical protein
MKTFNDLNFETISDGFMFGKKARIHFNNNYGASVVSHNFSYGGKQGLYELMVLYNDEAHYENTVADGDVRGYLTEDAVTILLSQIQKL